jgi:hypothetical protein
MFYRLRWIRKAFELDLTERKYSQKVYWSCNDRNSSRLYLCQTREFEEVTYDSERIMTTCTVHVSKSFLCSPAYYMLPLLNVFF